MKLILILILIIGLSSCGVSRKFLVPARTYQLDYHNDTVTVYNGKRLVGSYISQWNSQLDSLIMKDNE